MHPYERAVRWIVTESGMADATVEKTCRRLEYAVRHGFNIVAFAEGPAQALEVGGHYLQVRREATMAEPDNKGEAYGNDVRLLNNLSEAFGHHGVKWRIPKGRRGATPEYHTGATERLMALHPNNPAQVQQLALLELSVHTGLRRGEIARMRESHIDAQDAHYQVVSPSKDGPVRRLPFADPRIVQPTSWLQTWIQSRPRASNPDILWMNPTTHRPLAAPHVGTELFKLGKTQGTPLSFQRGRVSFACALYDAGADLLVLQEYLGHATVEQTRGYIRRHRGHLTRNTVEALAVRLPVRRVDGEARQAALGSWAEA